MTRVSAAAQEALARVAARVSKRLADLHLSLEGEAPQHDRALAAPLAGRPLWVVGRIGHGRVDPAAARALVESAAAEVDALLGAVTVAARAEQLAREMEVLREEHQAIVEHNLREHDRALSVERQDAQRLERLVCERTAELERTNRELSAASSLKDRFLWHISHEVRTPLHGLVGNLDLLRDTALDSGQRELLGMACGAAEALRTVVGDVVDFSRLEAGVLALEPADFELRAELGAILKVLGPQEGRLGAELICDVKPTVPDRLRADIGRIRQVLVNLVGNAMKFTAPGGEVRVTVAPAEHGEDTIPAGPQRMLEVCVADTGIGIPYEKQTAVFQPFWQVDGSAARLFEGAGLGLALASRLVQKLGGRIWFESEPARGTTFHFTLAVDVRGETGEGAQVPPDAPWRGARVLVIEKNATQRDAMTGLLTRLGAESAAVGAVADAIGVIGAARAEERPFTLTLLDVHAALDVGPRLAEALASAGGAAGPLVAVLPSGSPPSLAQRVLGVEVVGVVVKPVLEHDLASQLARFAAPVPAPARSRPAATADGIATARAGDAPCEALRVLVVEDNPINQKLAARMLGKRGYHVALASNGREALEAIDDACFDLVLMDVQMPEVDGLEATRRIRDRERLEGGHVPIIAMTASSLDGDRDRCLEAGMDLYLAKPVTAAALFATIDRAFAELDASPA